MGTERNRGELLKLGIVVSNRSIRRYRWRGGPAVKRTELAHMGLTHGTGLPSHPTGLDQK